jgi:hypothetical protein
MVVCCMYWNSTDKIEMSLYRVSAILWVKVVYTQLNQKVLRHFALRQTVNGIKGSTLTEELLKTTDYNYILTYLESTHSHSMAGTVTTNVQNGRRWC